jgi:hypothetical protein
VQKKLHINTKKLKYFKSKEFKVFIIKQTHYKMSTAITIVSKHTWSREEITLVTRAFLEGKSVKEAHSLVPDIKLNSVKQKYTTCASLDKKKASGVTKLHLDVWNELKTALSVPDVEAEATVIEEGSSGYWSSEYEEDDETYFKCTGTCGKVLHYEDTDGEGKCGICQFNLQKKGGSKNKRK